MSHVISRLYREYQRLQRMATLGERHALPLPKHLAKDPPQWFNPGKYVRDDKMPAELVDTLPLLHS